MIETWILVQYTSRFEPVVHWGPFQSKEEARAFSVRLQGKVVIFPLVPPKIDEGDEDDEEGS